MSAEQGPQEQTPPLTFFEALKKAQELRNQGLKQQDVKFGNQGYSLYLTSDKGNAFGLLLNGVPVDGPQMLMGTLLSTGQTGSAEIINPKVSFPPESNN